ncbi:MAG TPA: bifunctional salicylyl-CoA 5-hydroxylase/oxidoreductase [Longimicrobiales bacterium]|nr:bifunctional salicylyl-CoA 5-hydroxylase/oxidoreductase [Longimicrobiales bacterium]
MRIVIVGGGPAGLYLSLLMKRANPAHHVVVLERNRADETFGWGVVFSDQTLENLRAADPESCARITEHFAHWDDIDIHFRDTVITSSGHGFSGIARRNLLEIVQDRARDLDVDLRFRQDIRSLADLGAIGLADADVIVAADGANSTIRRERAASFRPTLDVRSARYIWLGTTLRLDAFTFIIVENEHGVFQVHGYRFDASHSTFIVECDERSWTAAGLDRMDTQQTIDYCERLFARWLDGHPLISNAAHRLNSPWIRFVRVSNERWFDGNVVLVGDAAHTAHFSIGSGTKLAMEDAISLAAALSSGASLERALTEYQTERKTEALRLQNAARNSMEWFEHVRRYMHLEPEQFAYSLLTRSQRVSHENLRLRDRGYLESVERWWASRAESAVRSDAKPGSSEAASTVPPMFTPFRLRSLELMNRIVVAPMDMYSAVDGTPNDFHLVHLGARALGGAALIMTEMTCTSPEARITLGCTGIYDAAHILAWRRIVDFVHANSRAAICLQLGHSGRKGSTRLMWEGMDEPLEEGGWDVIGPSALPYSPASQTPRPMTRNDMDSVRDEFVSAVRSGEAAGFDMVELHCAHGYLLSSFLTPVSNQRDDEYGGTLENRMRYPLEVFTAMREAWPGHKPMSVRISATDWVDGGITNVEAVSIARAFVSAGADIIHVSTGQTTPDAKPVYGRMYQTPFSDMIRNEARVATIAVGNISEADQVNSIIMAGRADLCALARPHLSDPNWTLRAAAQLGYRDQHWPSQYLAGRRQMERAFERMSGVS